MPTVVRFHTSVRQKYARWRQSLPNIPPNRDALLPVYIQQIGDDAVAKTVGQPLPHFDTVNGPFGTRFRVRVAKPKRDTYEVLVVDIL